MLHLCERHQMLFKTPAKSLDLSFSLCQPFVTVQVQLYCDLDSRQCACKIFLQPLNWNFSCSQARTRVSQHSRDTHAITHAQNNKQPQDKVFAISRIIQGLGRGYQPKPKTEADITLTQALIILDITKTESANNCFIIH